MKDYDLAVFIGRFQPFHNAHVEIINSALKLADHILILVGSAGQPTTYKNPFQNCIAEMDNPHRQMLNGILSEDSYSVDFILDYYDDVEWCKVVQEKVRRMEVISLRPPGDMKVALVGCDKDETSYYLKMFPQWDLIEMPMNKNLSSTHIRELYFVEEPNMDFIRGVVPDSVFNLLSEYKHSEWHNSIVNERRFIEKYKSQFASLPYKPTFVTVDAVVFQSGHVLLVRRNAYPGKGLIALPGGFLDAETDRSLEDAMIRELREETGLKVPSPVLRGNIKNTKVFDAPNRSARGRTITHAFNIVLPDGELPRVKGGTDADKAFWKPLSELNSFEFFEDHYEIINYFI